MLFCDDTLRSSFATCVSRGLKTVVARHRQNNPMVGILFSKEIIYRKNGSTVFNIFHGRPQIFVVQWSKKTVCTSASFENHLFLAHKAVLMLRRSGKMDGNVRCDKIWAKSLGSGNSNFTNYLVSGFFSLLTEYLKVYLSDTPSRELSNAFC